MDQWTEGPIQPRQSSPGITWSDLAKTYSFFYGVWATLAAYILISDTPIGEYILGSLLYLAATFVPLALLYGLGFNKRVFKRWFWIVFTIFFVTYYSILEGCKIYYYLTGLTSEYSFHDDVLVIVLVEFPITIFSFVYAFRSSEIWSKD